MSPEPASRTVLARLGLAPIAHILTLQDRNPHSPTYGCFDRAYWHYRIIDFPSGMAQEFVWPLALAWALPLPDNRFHADPSLREWIVAGLHYAASSAHADGSCDDYYPFERATGAAAFSLLACIESYDLLGLDDPELRAFFERRASWLARHEESGRLSNHEALIVLGLIRLGQVTGRPEPWEAGIERRLSRLLSWQSEEGWFAEYEGCDPGYLTLTISLLAEIDRQRPYAELREPLRRAIAFAAELVHPDGSYGGEYGSRNTLNFFPHGFELASGWMPEAGAINDRVLSHFSDQGAPCFDDDHILGHHAWNCLLAWRDFSSERSATASPPVEGRRWYPGAGFLIERRAGSTLYAGLGKGGVFKLFHEGGSSLSDTQLSARLRGGGGRLRTAVAHLQDDYEITLEEDSISVCRLFRLGQAGAPRSLAHGGASAVPAEPRTFPAEPDPSPAAGAAGHRQAGRAAAFHPPLCLGAGCAARRG